MVVVSERVVGWITCMTKFTSGSMESGCEPGIRFSYAFREFRNDWNMFVK